MGGGLEGGGGALNEFKFASESANLSLFVRANLSPFGTPSLYSSQLTIHYHIYHDFKYMYCSYKVLQVAGGCASQSLEAMIGQSPA